MAHALQPHSTCFDSRYRHRDSLEHTRPLSWISRVHACSSLSIIMPRLAFALITLSRTSRPRETKRHSITLWGPFAVEPVRRRASTPRAMKSKPLPDAKRLDYDAVSFTHQGWLSSDQKYIVFGDSSPGRQHRAGHGLFLASNAAQRRTPPRDPGVPWFGTVVPYDRIYEAYSPAGSRRLDTSQMTAPLLSVLLLYVS